MTSTELAISLFTAVHSLGLKPPDGVRSWKRFEIARLFFGDIGNSISVVPGSSFFFGQAVYLRTRPSRLSPAAICTVVQN
jgi:hypothetical protein